MTDMVARLSGGGKKRTMTRLLVCVGFVLLVAVVAFGAVKGPGWWRQQSAYRHSATPKAVAQDVTKAQDLALRGDFDKAHKALDDALDNPSLSAQAKHDLLVQQGITYENQKKYDAAMASYRQAESYKESLQVAQSIAHLAADKGDKTTAITYYKKAITLIPNDEPRIKENLTQYFNDMITYLQGGQPSHE